MKYDTVADRAQLFSIDKALNDNWDKIDDAVGACQDDLASITRIPDQTAQSGKYLTTDGTDVSWTTVNLDGKQDRLTAGDNISIKNNVISSTGFSGDYDDLTNAPTKLSEFENDIGLGGFVEGRDYDVIE